MQGDGQKLSSIYVDIEARIERLRRRLDDADNLAKEKAARIEQSLSNIKVDANDKQLRQKMIKSKARAEALRREVSKPAEIRFSDRLAKLKLSNVRKLHDQLKKSLERKINLNVSVESIKRTQSRLEQVEGTLRRIDGASKKVDVAAVSAGRSIATMGKEMLLAFGPVAAAIYAVQKIIFFLSDARDAAINQAQAQEGVVTAIERTGRAAGVTAQQLFREAAALQAITGVGDEITLKDVTNQLLTFGNIAGDVFLRTQRAVLDVNAVVNKGAMTGLSSQAIQLGKALNDPITGLSALTRSGIQFSDAQKDMIKGLVEQNKLTEAQGLILDEIEKQYGGQAEALAKAADGTLQLSAAVGDAAERIGKKFAPAVRAIAPILTRIFDGILPDAETNLQKVTKASEEQRSRFERLVRTYQRLSTQTERTAAQSEAYKRVIGELQRNYGSYLGNLDLERASFDKVATAIDKARTKLKDYAKEQAVLATQQDLLNDLSIATLPSIEAEIEIDQAKARLDELKAEFKATAGVAFEEFNLNNRSGAAIQKGNAKISALYAKIGAEQRNVSEQAGIINKSASDAAEIQERLNKLYTKFGDIIDKAGQGAGGGGNVKPELTVTPDVEIEKPDLSGYRDAFASVQDATQELFNQLKFDAAGYRDFRLNMIDQIVDRLRGAGVAEEEIERFKSERIKALNEEQVNFEVSKVFEAIDALRKSGATEIQIAEYVAQRKAELNEAELAAFQERENKKVEIARGTWEAIKADQERKFHFLDATYSSISGGLEDAMGRIRLSVQETDNFVQAAFKGMANSFIAEVSRMISKWLAFKALTTAASFLGISLPIGAASGGTFEVKGDRVRKMAGGGSFMVPGGFPNDSYPLRVQTGEKVTVSNRPQQNEQSDLLRQINTALKVQNMNMVSLSGRRGGSTNVNIEVDAARRGADLEYVVRKQEVKRRRHTNG